MPVGRLYPSGLSRMAKDGFLLCSHSLKICQPFVQKPQAGGAKQAVGEEGELPSGL